MNKATIVRKLQDKGHSPERANEIWDEAQASSNPAYVLHYYGIR